MKYYYLEIFFYTAKNKANAVMQKFIEKFQSSVIDEENLKLLKPTIQEKLNEVNDLFPRCKNIELSGYDFLSTESVGRISVSGNFNMNICRVEHFKLDIAKLQL